MDIEKIYELPFPVGDVYGAWTSPDTVVPPATRMEVEPIVGGPYRVIIETPDFSARTDGKFLVVEPERRVRYTWE